MTPAQRITEHFRGDWHGSYGSVPAPGHSSKDRGVTVKDADAGGVVFNAFNGADWRQLKDECRTLGLLPERERADNVVTWRTTGTYEFTDASGEVLYRTARKEKLGEKKRFAAERPDGAGGWVAGLGEVERVLYRLPDILAAPADATVYLVEGERKADRIASWGLPATAIAFGAKGWCDSYATALAGRSVAILPDNDDEGRGFAQRAADSLKAAGARPVIVDLPGLPPKGDIMDWQGSAADLEAATRQAATPASDLLLITDPGIWADARTPEREWALPDWIPAKQATYFTGAGATGKSLMSQLLCTCVAAGKPFLGIQPAQGVAIYVTCEDDLDELHRRQKSICDGLGVPLAALSGKLHLVSLVGALGNELATFSSEGVMTPTKAFERIRSTIRATRATFIVLDNVAHLFAGNENIRNQVAAFCSLLNNLAQEMSAAVLFLGHPNKAGAEYSGNTAWENQVRSRIYLGRPGDGDDDAVRDPDARFLTGGKVNYAQKGARIDFRWHKGTFVRGEDLPPNVADEMAATIAEAQALTRKAVDLAMARDVVALRLCMERLVPPRKERPVVFDFPAVSTAADHPMALSRILSAVAAGDLTPIEAQAFAGVMEQHRRAIDTAELVGRIEALEAKGQA